MEDSDLAVLKIHRHKNLAWPGSPHNLSLFPAADLSLEGILRNFEGGVEIFC